MTAEPITPGPAGPHTITLPDLPLAALVAGASDLMGDTAHIAVQPRCLSVSGTQHIDVQFDPANPGTLHALAQWAELFGGTLASKPIKSENGPAVIYRVRFSYYGVETDAYTIIPAETATT